MTEQTEPQPEPSLNEQEVLWHERALRKHLDEIAGRLRRIADDIEDQNVSRPGGSVASDVLEALTWGVANTKVGRLAYLGAQLEDARARVAMEAKA